jgi:hypothetical protein
MRQKFRYSPDFYKSVDHRAAETASLVFEILKRFIRIDSILDLGCGSGAWLKAALESGARTAIGVDLASAIQFIKSDPSLQNLIEDKSLLLIERDFVSDSVTLLPNTDVSMSLEVAEHVPKSVSSDLVKLLTKSSDYVVFSAAQRGQGGTFHINEQRLEYWVEEFARHGYKAYDPFRPELEQNKNIPRFYALNILLFIRQDESTHRRIVKINDDINQHAITDKNQIDCRTFSEKIRYWIVDKLPVTVVTQISKKIRY